FLSGGADFYAAALEYAVYYFLQHRALWIVDHSILARLSIVVARRGDFPSIYAAFATGMG
ncbi:hypothetical protein, partial [uncultured Cardiobacterium sp.]|uniref:hypothetical protein n=1 Tax=uncultured Cardiobacterium sp. TaxID=417619 RepID=UPI002636DD02